MPRFIPTNPVAAGWLAYSVWRKLTPAQRRLLLEVARTHGPRVASKVASKVVASRVASKAATAAVAAAKARRKR